MVASYIVGCGNRIAGRDLRFAFRNAVLGVHCPGLEEPAMFKLSLYDPIGIALLGFGVLAVTALAFVY